MKRIVTVQDISCVGKCSLTVALPIISAMGVEAAILPTAVLSNHTMFREFTCKDLTDQIESIQAVWQREGLTFDAVYTGYLGSFEQIDLMKTFFRAFKTEQNLIFVDPAMADNGKLYPAFDESYARHMATLCAEADVIVPNITEACFMTGMEYQESYDKAYIDELLQRTAALGAATVVLTGVSYTAGKTGVVVYKNGEQTYYEHHKIAKGSHGTGDVYASAFVGALMNDKSAEESARIAADYTVKCIENTQDDPTHWYGVKFETALKDLIMML